LNPARRRAWAALLLLALTLPAILYGVVKALESNSNDPRQWLPRGFHETELYREFQDQFGRDEITVVTWEGCTLEDPRVEQLARAVVDEGSGAYQRALTGPRLLRQMVAAPSNIPLADAVQRLEGILIGPDGLTTCVIFILSKSGAEDRVAAVEELLAAAEAKCGLKPGELHLGGPTVDAATIDIESQRMLTELTLVSAVIAFCITWWRIRSFWLAAVVLATSAYSTGLALSVLYYTGGNMNLLMTMLPPLVYVLTISSAVHLGNYYKDAVVEEGLDGAPRRAVQHGWAPCLLASLTTAVGLCSLATSTIVPIHDFGIYSAIGMALSIVVLFVFMPAVLTLWPVRSLAVAPAERPAEASAKDFSKATAFISRHHLSITAGSLLLMVAAGVGLARLKSTVKLQHRFAEDSKIIADYEWMEKHLGPLVPLEVVIGFDTDCPWTFFERMQFVAWLEGEFRKLPDVGATMSAATFAPTLPVGASTRDTARRAAMAPRLAENRRHFIDAGFVAETGGQERWRISVRVNALGDVDYAHFTENLRNFVDPMLQALPVAGVDATYTGVIPLIYKAQRQLFNDLVRSFFLAFGVIALVMIVALRSPAAGMLSMAPNLFPAVVVFGLMGWRGVLIEIGSVMTASAALGIAVDDTFHFLTWFCRASSEGKPRREALSFAYQRCAGAMATTTLICSCGLAVFALSTFMPIVHFAWMMVSLLAAALAGDLIFLPAMLAGPLGRVFRRSRSILG
jgi:hypothetical protein